ncbi:MAG: hypothetical protein LIO96_09845 [Lachnospiraceae bacterium]|nr:hypothetical protein [Lachnospiraceae bacterium]
MKYYLIEDACVMCGAYVPEGEWVCPNCIKKYEAASGSSAEMRRTPIPQRRKKFSPRFPWAKLHSQDAKQTLE